MYVKKAHFVLSYNVCRNLPTSSLESFVADFLEAKPHTVIRSSLQLLTRQKLTCTHRAGT